MQNVDILVQQYFSLVRTQALTEFFYLLTIIFDFSLPFILLCVCVAGLVYLVRGAKYAALFATAIALGGIAIYVSKIFFNVPRPLGGVMAAFGQSFPSGHATIAAIFFIMLMYIFDDHLHEPWRILFNIFCTIMIFLVAFSRVYLGVHWVTDVAGGILLGSIISLLLVLAFRKSVLK